jgi:hypothetical protein
LSTFSDAIRPWTQIYTLLAGKVADDEIRAARRRRETRER